MTALGHPPSGFRRGFRSRRPSCPDEVITLGNTNGAVCNVTKIRSGCSGSCVMLPPEIGTLSNCVVGLSAYAARTIRRVLTDDDRMNYLFPVEAQRIRGGRCGGTLSIFTTNAGNTIWIEPRGNVAYVNICIGTTGWSLRHERMPVNPTTNLAEVDGWRLVAPTA